MMNKRQQSLMPNGIPKYVRCYDNGGRSADRYTVVFTGKYPKNRGEYVYLAMDENPYHPQGFGQHGYSKLYPPDANKDGWAPDIGRNHPTLGRRIEFQNLPIDCQKLVVSDYINLWNLAPEKP